MALQNPARTTRPPSPVVRVRPDEDELREDRKDLAYIDQLDAKGNHRWITLSALKKKLGR